MIFMQGTDISVANDQIRIHYYKYWISVSAPKFRQMISDSISLHVEFDRFMYYL